MSARGGTFIPQNSEVSCSLVFLTQVQLLWEESGHGFEESSITCLGLNEVVRIITGITEKHRFLVLDFKALYGMAPLGGCIVAHIP